jgi:phosphohistidine swiveling domain-containing protein
VCQIFEERILEHHLVSFEDFITLITPATEQDLSQLEQDAFRGLALAADGDGVSGLSDGAILAHYRRFPYLAYNHISYGTIFSDSRQRAGMLRVQETNSTPGDARSWEKKQLFAQQERILEQHTMNGGDTEQLRRVVNCAHRVSLTRMRVKSVYVGMDLALIPLVKVVAAKLHAIDNAKEVEPLVLLQRIEELHWLYTINEMEQLLRSNGSIRVSQKVLAQRRDCYVYVLEEGRLVLKSGSQAKQHYAAVPLAAAGNTDVKGELQGSVASLGCVRGTARVHVAGRVGGVEDIAARCQPGDIFVSTMTQPDLIDVLTRCGGVITDEGGILCHAAIIARELKIPCIVGTGCATKSICDGDDVEILLDGRVGNHTQEPGK